MSTLKGRLIWVADAQPQGWACSQCDWTFSRPTLLTNNDAKNAYDRLAAASFAKHDCTNYAQRAHESSRETFAERARKLIMRGFKPKDAVEITLQEMKFEHRGDPKFIERAHEDAEDFIRRVKEGLI